MEELKQKLLCTTLELEALKVNSKEEMRKSEQSIDQLLKLLQVITHERDEARGQLKLLLSKLKHIPKTRELRLSPVPDSIAGECGSSSPVGSPELPSVKLAAAGATRTGSSDHSKAGAVMDWLVMNRPLPQKGKLLQAVLEAGPTLQTLLLAGPLVICRFNFKLSFRVHRELSQFDRFRQPNISIERPGSLTFLNRQVKSVYF